MVKFKEVKSVVMQKIFLVLVMIFSAVSSYSQLINDSVLVDGHYRAFHFNKPQATGSGSSLIFILHGSGGDGKGTMKSAEKLEQQSQAENLLLVYPDGYKKFWNECRKASTAAANIENVDEDAFFSKMIEYFAKNYKTNSKHVFAIGTSGGGHMAYKLALTMPQKIKAITAIIANLPEQSNLDCPEAKLPISVMIINGTADSTNPFNGGLVKIPGTSFGNVRSTEQTFQYWASLDGYTGAPIKENLPDVDPNDGKTIERYSYKNAKKPSVILLKVIGGKHDYPNDINVYLEAWNFFKGELNK